MPIVVVTGAAGSADIARAVRAGANQVLVKPCGPDVVANAARSALDSSDALAAAPAPQPAAAQPAPPQMPARPIKPRGRSRGFQRHITTTPPGNPPDLRCPVCDDRLTYQHSHIGGVNEDSVEQWDYFHAPRLRPVPVPASDAEAEGDLNQGRAINGGPAAARAWVRHRGPGRDRHGATRRSGALLPPAVVPADTV